MLFQVEFECGFAHRAFAISYPTVLSGYLKKIFAGCGVVPGGWWWYTIPQLESELARHSVPTAFLLRIIYLIYLIE